MPYENEPASPTAHFSIIRNPEVRSFLGKCIYNRAPADQRGDEVRRRLLDVSNQVVDVRQGIVLASDGSPYEAIVEEKFPSVRVGFVKLSTVIIDIVDYLRIRDHSSVFVDPVEVARIQQSSESLSVVLPGAGITSDDHADSRSFFRHTVFSLFRSKLFSLANWTLYDTFTHLIRETGRTVLENGVEGIHFRKGKKCPSDDSALPEHLFVPIEPGWAVSPTGGTVYVTDALRVHEPFVDDGSNQEVFNRLMSALEHLLMIHVVRCAAEIDSSVTDDLYVIMDGPLAIFGEPAKFHRGIMKVLAKIKKDANKRGKNGPVVIGLSKTGKIVEHMELIEHLIQYDVGEHRRSGTWILPIDDEYRYSYIQPSWLPSGRNFGDDTYYGQNFILRTSQGKMFDVCLAYPFTGKDAIDGRDFKEVKMQLGRYGHDLSRMVSLIEMMQMDLYKNSVTPVHLAHKYASIAHSPSGRSLDQLVRELVRRR